MLKKINYHKVGSLLNELRNELGLTQQDLANSLRVSKAAISQWEAGSGIKTEQIYNISKYFNIKPSELIEGKLTKESVEDVWRRNYDLLRFEFDYIDDNIDDVKQFYDHILMIKERFFELLPLWASNELSNQEIVEFKYLKKYFLYDFRYEAMEKDKISIYFDKDEHEKGFVLEIYNKVKKLPFDSYQWEMSKLYDWNEEKYELKANIVLESQNLKALEYLLLALSQPQKDELLQINLEKTIIKEEKNLFGLEPKKVETKVDYTIEEIEEIPWFKIMLNSGCNIFTYHLINYSIKPSEYDFLTGKIEKLDFKVNSNICNTGFYSNSSGWTSINAIKNWKNDSYEMYQKSIDFSKTEYYRDIVNLKDKEPLKYLKKLLRREGVEL